MIFHPSPWRRWQNFIPLLTCSVLLGFSQSQFAFADIVRITSINNVYETNHAPVVNVHPGDTIPLLADVFTETYYADGSIANYLPQNRNVEEFIWNADDSMSDECDAGQSISCLDTGSNFEVHDYGMNFYVPYSMGREITITVRNKDNWSSDTVVLHNVLWNEDTGYTPPTTIITNPEDYQKNYNTFNPDYALAGQGRWVIIAGTRYWVPYTYETAWVPYQHGTWTWVDGDGWTWTSYDPWGWYTDHYGCWRHHGTYGWVWLPFETPVYRPHTVTWFYGDNYVGWYPYYDGYRAGYIHGETEGFIDGYWTGYDAALYYRSPGFLYHRGITTIYHSNFVTQDVFSVRIGNVELSLTSWYQSYSSGYYGYYVGGGTTIYSSRVYIEQRVSSPIYVTQVNVYNINNIQIRQPVYVNPIPTVYRPVAVDQRFTRPIPVASVIRAPAPGSTVGKPVIIPPTSNGRGIAQPPIVVNPNNGTAQPIPPRTPTPATPHKENPIYRPAPPTTVQPKPVPLPPYRPGNPPVSQPAPAPVPRPQPPAPAPRPQPPAPAPRPQPPAPAPRPQPPAPAPRPQPPAPAPRPQPPAPAPRPQPPAPAPRPQPPRPGNPGHPGGGSGNPGRPSKPGHH